MQDTDDILKVALDYLNHEKTYVSDSSIGTFELPWDINANDFLQYAERDITGKEPHHLVNALSNSKRAMECQADSLLLAYGMYNYAKKQRWGLPKKLEVLQNMGMCDSFAAKKNKLR
jgi:hypothetical protein